MPFKFDANRCFWILSALATFLVITNLIVIFSPSFTGKYLANKLFNLDLEQNIPTFFSALNLLISSLLLFIIAVQRRADQKRDFYYWIGLSLIFIFLSVDEFSSIHEILINKVRDTLNTTGYLYFAWVIPYAIAVVTIGLIYLKFVISLPPGIRLQFILAGSIYIGGALGMEMVGSNQYAQGGADTSIYKLITTVEETLEILGIILFIRALLAYMELNWQGLHLRFGPSE